MQQLKHKNIANHTGFVMAIKLLHFAIKRVPFFI